MKKLYSILLLTFFALCAKSHIIDFVLLDGANKSYSFAIHNGLYLDTIAKGAVSPMGIGHIPIPSKYENIPAMGMLMVGNNEPLYLIVNSENFSFEQTKDRKLTFNGSNENELFYNKQNEVMNNENSSTYAHAYAKTMAAVVKTANVLNKQGMVNLFDKSNARLALLNDVDVDKLYYSRFWYFVIDGLLRMSIGQEGFGNDMIRLLDKTKTDKVYTAFVEDLITITNQYGLDTAFDIIIPHVEKSKRIEYPQGSVYDAFAMARVQKGTKAPSLKGLTQELGATGEAYTLLIFHQPECESCMSQLKEIEEKYTQFEKKKVRVITISGALEKEVFEEERKSFKWADQLCDYNGFAGQNFQKYGIVGTPTLYLLDDKSVVLGRFSRILQIENYLNKAL